MFSYFVQLIPTRNYSQISTSTPQILSSQQSAPSDWRRHKRNNLAAPVVGLAEGVVADFLAVGFVVDRVAAESVNASSEVVVALIPVPSTTIAASLKISDFATTSLYTARTTFATLRGPIHANLGLAGPLTIRTGGKSVKSKE
jgi:hypothetical protein